MVTIDNKYSLNIIQKDGQYCVIVTELPDNPGRSVTNAWPELATQIYHALLKNISPDKINWYEYYPENVYSGKKEASFDQVFLKWNGKEFISPSWARTDLLAQHLIE